jgi:hypothetical protein
MREKFEAVKVLIRKCFSPPRSCLLKHNIELVEKYIYKINAKQRPILYKQEYCD